MGRWNIKNLVHKKEKQKNKQTNRMTNMKSILENKGWFRFVLLGLRNILNQQKQQITRFSF